MVGVSLLECHARNQTYKQDSIVNAPVDKVALQLKLDLQPFLQAEGQITARLH